MPSDPSTVITVGLNSKSQLCCSLKLNLPRPFASIQGKEMGGLTPENIIPLKHQHHNLIFLPKIVKPNTMTT